VATIGKDYANYFQWLEINNIGTEGIKIIQEEFYRRRLHNHRQGRQPDYGIQSRRYEAQVGIFIPFRN